MQQENRASLLEFRIFASVIGVGFLLFSSLLLFLLFFSPVHVHVHVHAFFFFKHFTTIPVSLFLLFFFFFFSFFLFFYNLKCTFLNSLVISPFCPPTPQAQQITPIILFSEANITEIITDSILMSTCD
jgi:hypothetical protein